MKLKLGDVWIQQEGASKLVHPLVVCIFNLVTLLKEVDEDGEVVTVAIDK